MARHQPPKLPVNQDRVPPIEIPPPPTGGTVTLAQKAEEILGAEGAKENVYKALKAPKLIYTVILWYRFVVRPPPPPGGGNQHFVTAPHPPGGGDHHFVTAPPGGGGGPTKGGGFQGEGDAVRRGHPSPPAHCH